MRVCAAFRTIFSFLNRAISLCKRCNRQIIYNLGQRKLTHSNSVSAEVIKYGERSKGFGFVTYNTKEEAAKAIETLNDKDLEGRPANVKLSKPKTDAPKPKRAPRKVCIFCLLVMYG